MIKQLIIAVFATIILMAFIGLTVSSCKDENNEASNRDGHHMEASNVNSDTHHNEEATHDNSDGHHDGNNGSSMTNTRDIKINAQKNPATTAIIDAYIQIKNGLAADSRETAAKGGKALIAAFSKFDMSKLTGETRNEYTEIAESAKEQAEHIIENPIDHQREHFETLSTDVNDLISLLGTEKILYQDYCPMKKVIWLSETKVIKNPYYGSEMLTCGSVKKEIN